MTRHILLIDDSEAIQLAVSSVLAEHDYAITTASGATEGLTYIKQQPYDLILLDYGLPDSDGLQVLRQIKAAIPDQPVVMITGSGSEHLAVTALKGGAVDYIVKTNDFIPNLPHVIRDTLEKCDIQRRNRDLEEQLRESYKKLKQLNSELEAKVQGRTEELERAYQLSNELMTKAVDSNMQLAELYSEVDESRRKLDAKIRELTLLNELGRTMSAAQDQDVVLQVALDAVSQEVEAEHCAILLLSPDNQHVQVGASRGTPDDLLLAAKSCDGEQLLLQILQEHKPVLVQDIEGHARFAPLAQDFPEVDSCMVLPLWVKQFHVGLLTIYGSATRKTLTQEECDFLAVLADQTAIALANVRLNEQRLQQEQMAKLGKITQYVLRQFRPTFDAFRQYADQLQHTETLTAAEQQAIGRKIRAACDAFREVADDLSEFTRSQRGPLRLETVQVKDLISDFLATVEPTFAQSNLSILTDLQYTAELVCDVRKIQRVLAAIVENARQAMAPGGTLTIESRLENHGILFEFRDTGGGMSPDIQAHLFEPFVSGAGTREAGLGLAMARKILDEHHARIEVRSVLTQGTTVRLRLPRIQHGQHANQVAQRAAHTQS